MAMANNQISAQINLRFLLRENKVGFPGLVIDIHRVSAIMATLIQQLYEIIYRKVASNLQKRSPKSHFIRKYSYAYIVKLNVQYKRSEKARFKMKNVVGHWLCRWNLQR